MYNPDPDRAHDPDRNARDALTELGHTPGEDPVAELHAVAADLIEQCNQAQAELGDPPTGAGVLALADLFAQCATALLPLADTQLDAEEQVQIAVRLSFPPGGPQ